MILAVITSFFAGLPSAAESLAPSKANWKVGSLARAARVECEFNLTVIQNDSSLSDRYFPNSVQPRRGVPARLWNHGPQSSWLEDLVRVGDRYRFRVEFRTRDGSEAPAGFDSTVLFDGD